MFNHDEKIQDQKKGRGLIRMLSSHDYMINDGGLRELIGRPQMLTILTGDHFGYGQTAWFDQLLIKKFSNRKFEFFKKNLTLLPFRDKRINNICKS